MTEVDRARWTADDLPVIGEPFSVEFANTLYQRGDDAIDVLATGDVIRLWFGHAPAASKFTPPARLSRDMCDAVGEIRDSVRGVLLALLNGDVDDDRDVARWTATLNRFSSLTPSHLTLRCPAGSKPTASLVHVGRPVDAFLAMLATSCIEFLAGPDVALVRRCDGAECPMLFVMQHRKRRFCQEACSHRARQARYYRTNHAGSIS